MVQRPLLERMTEMLRHRGPDDAGYHLGKGIGLGARRLSIIDIEGGHQPMSNEDGTIWVAQNGEIYNYKELRESLRQRGHRFKTVSDTETIVHAYEEFGDDFCRELNGDFAIAIWDARRQRLVLARDRFGVHPLYYCVTGEGLLFASELKSLLCHPDTPRDWDPVAVDRYLTLRYAPCGRTLLRQVKKLPPASCLVWENSRAQVRSYWSLPAMGSLDADYRDENACAEELRALLADSVRLRMRSDVPVGAYLSGGLDSSTVVGLMTRFTSQPVQTFCVGFGTDMDELEQARALARGYRTEHHEIVVGGKDYELLPKIVWHLDEPIGDAIVMPIYRLAQEAARKVKVVLSGEGADEVWSGYIHHLAIQSGTRLRRVLGRTGVGGLRRLLRATPAGVLNRFFPYPADLGERGKGVLLDYLGALAGGGLKDEYFMLASVFRGEDKEELYTGDFRVAVQTGEDGFADHSALLEGEGDRLGRVIAFDLAHWLPDYTLLKQDKLGLAHSLEIRVPFLDHRIAELAARLPATMKIRGLETKRLLRLAASGIVPADNAQARKKAFYMPVEKTLGPDYDAFVRDVLGSQRCRQRGIVDGAFLDAHLDRVRSPELLVNKQMFALLMLELWMRAFVDGDGWSPVTTGVP